MSDEGSAGWAASGLVEWVGVTVGRCSTWRGVIAGLVGVVGSVGGLAWRQARLSGLDLLDSRGWYTPDAAAGLVDSRDRLAASALAGDAAPALTIDMVFPASYGLLFAMLLLRMFRGRAPLYLLPVTAALADALENVTVAALALSHDGAPSPLAWAAGVFTSAKTVLFVATLCVICVGGIGWMGQRLSRRQFR
ncbi:MAG: hypothetical protein F4Z36_05910 [Acidimicrobiia bacterium]|nr:hypothetical protein [Acidimicrobiia bacterium]